MNRRPRVVPAESMQKSRVSAKPLSPSVELAHMAQLQTRSAVHRPNDAAHPNVLSAKLHQFAHLFAVLGRIHDRKTASLIWCIRRADVEKLRSIGKLNDVVHVC